MSIDQIKREFPFLWQAFSCEDLPSDATIDIRVSRLSLDAFELPMEETREPDYLIFRELCIVDAKGLGVFPEEGNGQISTDISTMKTIGDVLLHYFPIFNGEEWAENTSYLIYRVFGHSLRWYRIKGSKKPHGELQTRYYEAIVFKMPKTKTLWQLIQRYRKNKRTTLRH
jgi:hypothetical protein